MSKAKYSRIFLDANWGILQQTNKRTNEHILITLFLDVKARHQTLTTLLTYNRLKYQQNVFSLQSMYYSFSVDIYQSWYTVLTRFNWCTRYLTSLYAINKMSSKYLRTGLFSTCFTF